MRAKKESWRKKREKNQFRAKKGLLPTSESRLLFSITVGGCKKREEPEEPRQKEENVRGGREVKSTSFPRRGGRCSVQVS